ncbi:hypothetical protein CJ030_MR0G006020 [Morella rubra]|uniref:Uncharacterized protein n=1 Tax=Morella rubra TaxID=262757 RepID=A0A6A1UP36_9ROSI|nr:hypothetical protein CJ030_MR0G006020 [Morella rubra]
MHEVQSEKGELMSKFEEVNARNVELEAEVKILKCALDKSNTQLQQFSSGTKKLDHMLSLGLHLEIGKVLATLSLRVLQLQRRHLFQHLYLKNSRSE